MWFRVELDATGKVIKTEPTEAQELPGGGLVFHIKADNAFAAGKAAMNLYARKKVKDTRDRYKAEGRCPCGRDRDLEGVLCSVCLENATAGRERRKLRGEGGRHDDAQRLEKTAARVRDRKAEMRLEALCELQAKLGEFKSVQAARIWVQAEIRRLKGLSPIRSVG